MSASPRPFSPAPSVLSPHRRDRSSSRPSSRSSLRAGSPALNGTTHFGATNAEDPVAIRNQISSLKHTIRHQQAQVLNLENALLTSPRLPGMSDLASIPVPSSPSKTPRVQKRSSFEVLHGIAGPDSGLPLPRRDGMGSSLEDDSIQEGVPMSFGTSSAMPSTSKRASSPTRTLSRIPVSAVGNARALADEGQGPSTYNGHTHKLSPIDVDLANPSNSTSNSTSTHLTPPSPNRRHSLTPGGTTKVLADLQTGVINARNALENTKAQLRLSQRTVAQLTRQTEDLKEGRERLRLENEGLNNVVARKERLLQEVLERARKAEAEAAALKTQLKSETTASKKSMKEMESALTESTALSQKSEREYLTLRDSIKHMTESWKSDVTALKDEMQKREDSLRSERDGLANKYQDLVREVKEAEEVRSEVRRLREEDKRIGKEVEEGWMGLVMGMKTKVDQNSKATDKSSYTADYLADELARIKRLMQAARTESPPPADS